MGAIEVFIRQLELNIKTINNRNKSSRMSNKYWVKYHSGQQTISKGSIWPINNKKVHSGQRTIKMGHFSQ